MDFPEACALLSDWVAASKGNPIGLSSGAVLSFTRKRTYSDEEVDQFESQLPASLPSSYKTFLKVIGVGEYFVDQYGLGVLFHPLEEIRGYQADVFAGR